MENLNDLLKGNHRVNLKKEFMDACHDKDFKSYVESVSIPDEKLYKYTFMLQDCVEERKICKKCTDYFSCQNKVKGYVLTPRESGNRVMFDYVACKKCIEYTENTKNITYYDVPTSIKKASFKEMYKDDKSRIAIIKYFKEFTDKYKKGERVKGLFLTGSFGSGKTYMIASLFNELSKIGIKSTIVYYPEFLISLKASFKDDFEERFDYVRKSPILLIDDIGAENCSGWNRDEILSPILQYRMDEHLPTFFTSNCNLKELEEHLAFTNNGKELVKSRRIIERIKETSTVMELVSKNRRT